MTSGQDTKELPIQTATSQLIFLILNFFMEFMHVFVSVHMFVGTHTLWQSKDNLWEL